MEPVVAAANPETGYGLSGVRLPPAVSSRVGVVVLVKHLSATGADAVKRPKPNDDWFTNNLLQRIDMREWLLADPRWDIDDIVRLADEQYGPETDGILTRSPATLKRHATITATVQLFDKSKELLAVCRSHDDPNRPDGSLLGFCWFDRGGYTTYSIEEISNSKFHFVDLTLPVRLRIALINEMIDQHILWAGNCGVPVVCSTSIRMEHNAFVKIHEKRGFTVNGSYAWIRTEKGLEWLRSQTSKDQ